MPGVAFPPVGPVGLGSPPSQVLGSATTPSRPVSGCFARRSLPDTLRAAVAFVVSRLGSRPGGSPQATPGPLVARSPFPGMLPGARGCSHVPTSPLCMPALLSDPGGVLGTRHVAPSTAAFRPLETVGFLLDTTLRSLLLSTTLLLSGLHHTACILATPGSVHPIAGIAHGCAPDLLARLSSGGMGAILARTHWVTTTSFLGSLPIPRFWASLGTTRAGLGPYAAVQSDHEEALSCVSGL